MSNGRIDAHVIMDEFEEGGPGIFVGHPEHPIPFLFSIYATEDSESIYIPDITELDPHGLALEITDHGTPQSIVPMIDGYPVTDVPKELDQPLYIEYADQVYRMYMYLSIDSNKAIPCYVPYSVEMKYHDRWMTAQRKYPFSFSHATGTSSDASQHSYRLKTLH